ncbi:J domain-containing protein [Candidatus Pacearchaeota archaeon]|nr:J domain-containing protein [Candidatus Pacearchaeota archaeon]
MTLDEARNILGVSDSASSEDIKRSFKKKCLETHPDRNPGKEEEFKKINEACQVLTGKQKPAEQQNQQTNYSGFPGVNLNDLFGGMHFDFDSFNNMFKRRQKQDIPEHDKQINLQLNMTVEEIKRGKIFQIEYTKSKKCNACNGVGGSEKTACKNCNGTGMFEKRERRQGFMYVAQSVCNVCSGNGVQINNLCKVCDGFGESCYKERLNVEVKEKK